ncbi:hypothetical protein J6590_081008 [Homalodisca vitripennis]|nr:hypothetical protein J6590_081008 [Homalodisca vitripennis]
MYFTSEHCDSWPLSSEKTSCLLNRQISFLIRCIVCYSMSFSEPMFEESMREHLMYCDLTESGSEPKRKRTSGNSARVEGSSQHERGRLFGRGEKKNNNAHQYRLLRYFIQLATGSAVVDSGKWDTC